MIIKNKKLAFSLIELSIVILVIGILVIGVTQGSRIINTAKLKSAADLTRSSPINSTTNLSFWYETTGEKSFDVEVEDGSSVATWYDNTFNQSTTQNNATQNTPAQQPIYIKSAINGLPALRFDDANSSRLDVGTVFYSGEKSLLGRDFTIFVVEQRRSNKSSNFIIGGWSNAASFALGYSSNTNLQQNWTAGASSANIAVSGYSNPIPRIITATGSSVFGRTIAINSGTPVVNSGYITPPGATTTGCAIGFHRKTNSDYYNGDIAEIIIFNRYLKSSEIRAIEEYLSQKWAIKLS